MLDLEYVDQLIKLAYQHDNDTQLCWKSCNECKLDTKIKLIAQETDTTYCEILVSICHAWKNKQSQQQYKINL